MVTVMQKASTSSSRQHSKTAEHQIDLETFKVVAKSQNCVIKKSIKREKRPQKLY